MTQIVNNEGHFAPREVSVWRQERETVADFHCRTCRGRFMSREMVTLHTQMEHPTVFTSYCDAQSQIEFLVEPVRSPESWCIYKRTAALVANDISSLSKRNERLDMVRSAYDSLLDLERLCRSASGRVALLTGAMPQRARLVELSSGLLCRQGPLWEALKIDDRSIFLMLQIAVSHDEDVIMGLREDSAASFLTLIDSVLYSGEHGHDLWLSHQPALTLDTEGFRYNLRRISIRLSMVSYQLPKGLYITGVTLADLEQVAARGYTNIRAGRYHGRLVALKTMRVSSRQKLDELSKNQKAFCREILLLHGLNHPNISGLIGVDRELFGHFCLVTEWMPYGNIMEFIATNSFVLGEVKRFVIEIASALAYLHGENVAHGNLHVGNILIDAGRHVRLTDFGLSDSCDASSANASSASTGAIRYMAPEILHPEKYGLRYVRHTPESDVHSFAMCVWAAFNGDSPFHDFPAVVASLSIISGKRPPVHTASHDLPSPLWSLLTLCWQERAVNRPSSHEVYHRLKQMFRPSAPSNTHSTTPAVSKVKSAGLSRPYGETDSSGNELTSSSEPENVGCKPTTQQFVRQCRVVQPAGDTPIIAGPPPPTMIWGLTARPGIDPPVNIAAPQTVRHLASRHPDAERLVPQTVYRPSSAVQLRAGHASQATPISPIMFYIHGPRGCGISCNDALNGRFAGLQDPDALVECPRSMMLRVMWPDYEPWSATILLHPGTSRADLAMCVSLYAQRFLDESLTKCLRDDTRWRLGPGAITLSDLELVGLQPVTARDWQVHFRVRQATLQAV